VCGCLAMETLFMKLTTNSSCADITSRGSSELGSACCNQGQTILTSYALQHSWSRSVSLCVTEKCVWESGIKHKRVWDLLYIGSGTVPEQYGYNGLDWDNHP
jgi:hypothetical protein